MPANRKRVQTMFDDPSLTVQSQADETRITTILAKYKKLGILDHLRNVELQFKDVSEFTDLKDAFIQARQAESEFMKLPSKVRELFDHDVAVWLDTAHDKDKLDALRPKLAELGLLPDSPEVAPPSGAGVPASAPGGAGSAESPAS